MSIHERIETAFTRWGRQVFRSRWPIVVGALLLTAGLVAQIPDMRADFSGESFLSRADPSRIVFEDFRREFGAGNRILLGIDPPEVFTLAFLDKLRRFHADLQAEVPHLEKITSLINARNTRGEADELIVEDLLQDWPEGPEDLARLRERVLANPLYLNTLVSESARFTSVVIEPNTWSSRGTEGAEMEGFDDASATAEEPELLAADERAAMLLALHRVIERHDAADFPIHAIGAPLMAEWFNRISARDSATFTSLSILMIFVLLYLLFRRTSAVLLAIVVNLAAISSTFGCMVLLDIPFSAVLQILPSFLIAVGVCDSVHILTIFFQRLGSGDSREDAIAFTLGHSGLAVVMTSITTAGALASFAATSIVPVANLGIISPIGVLFALLYSMTLLPALLALVPMSPAAKGGGMRERLSGRLEALGRFSNAYPRAVLGVTAALLLLAVAGVAQVRFAHEPMQWLPERDPFRIATELVDREFGGSETIELLVDSGVEDGLHEPDTLRRIEQVMRYGESLDDGAVPIGKATSIVDVVKEIHQALNENRVSHYALPDERRLIAQELLLFENSGSDDLEDLADTRFSRARISLRVPQADGFDYKVMLGQLTPELVERLDSGLTLSVTGNTVLAADVFTALGVSLAISYAIALLVITPLMVILIGRLGLGLLAMVPNIIPVLLSLGLMGWVGIPLNFSTMLLGSIVLGLAVDDTIHFMHKFSRYYDVSGNVEAAVEETLMTTGVAMLITSIVLSLGFAMFCFGYITSLLHFGVVIAFATATAFLADVLVAPALLTLVMGRHAASTHAPLARSA